MALIFKARALAAKVLTFAHKTERKVPTSISNPAVQHSPQRLRGDAMKADPSDLSTLWLLAAGLATGIAAITAYIFKLFSNKRTSLVVKMGDLQIKIEGAISKEQANTIVKAISDSKALEEHPSKDGGQI